MASASSLHATKIKERPPAPLVHNIVFNAFFLVAILTLHGFQLLSTVLWLFPQTRALFWDVQVHIERQFAVLLTFISRFFGPTKLRISGEGDLSIDKIVKRDSNGKVISVTLPNRSVLMGNHQVYLDWTYCWIILYNASLHGALIIILKHTLKWTPVVGPAMQLFRFVFLRRKFEDDKLTLSAALLAMANKARAKANPLVLMIFPEGTLVSSITRPISKKFAEKLGIEDMRHTLLPRSTGLLFCLRSLAKGIPDLKLIDATIAYEGIPLGGYGQDYYTLQSVFGARTPPPMVHIHLRSYDVHSEVPIGNPHTDKGAVGAADASAEERDVFDKWLRARWTEKDKQLDRFYSEGRLVSADADYVDLDAAPRRDGDIIVLLGTMLAGAIVWRYAIRFVFVMLRWLF